jgi:hypothetical protein
MSSIFNCISLTNEGMFLEIEFTDCMNSFSGESFPFFMLFIKDSYIGFDFDCFSLIRCK